MYKSRVLCIDQIKKNAFETFTKRLRRETKKKRLR